MLGVTSESMALSGEPNAALPRMTQAGGALTREIEILDEYGQRRTISIPIERPLTVFVDKRELVTLRLAVTPTCHWLEHMDFGSSILANPCEVIDGCVTAQGPGLGMAWNEAAVAKYLIG